MIFIKEDYIMGGLIATLFVPPVIAIQHYNNFGFVEVIMMLFISYAVMMGVIAEYRWQSNTRLLNEEAIIYGRKANIPGRVLPYITILGAYIGFWVDTINIEEHNLTMMTICGFLYIIFVSTRTIISKSTIYYRLLLIEAKDIKEIYEKKHNVYILVTKEGKKIKVGGLGFPKLELSGNQFREKRRV